jgi:putative ABC transport system substrate-binding protein
MRRIGLAVVLAVSLALAPQAPEAQQAGKVFRIGILGNLPVTDPEGGRLWGGFTQGLRELGYVEGQNITIEQRSSEGQYERLPALAADLVRLKVDVIVTPTTQNALAAAQVTRTIPIVVASGDPLSTGLVLSYARPGGNVTGLSFLGPEIAGKQLELLTQIAPRVSRVAVLWNPGNPNHPLILKELSVAARALRLQLQPLEAREPEMFEPAFAAMTKERAGALLVPADAMFLLHRARIVDFAAKHRLPAMYGMREHVDVGGLLFYGPSLYENFRRAATYVDKILKGAKPADLPVEQPSTFALVINMKTAKALGLTIPQSVLGRADQIIE